MASLVTRVGALALAVSFLLVYAPHRAQAASVSVLDTGAASADPLAPNIVSERKGWAAVPEGEAAHKFKGDAVLSNERLTIVLRPNGPGAEVYAHGPKGPSLRAVLAPASDAAARIASVAVGKIAADAAGLDATFQTPDGKTLAVRFELTAGQVFVKTEAGAGTAALRVRAPSRFVVLPDFFADDIVVDARDIAVDKAELPSENFLLHLVGDGEAIVFAVATARDEDVPIVLADQGDRRAIQHSDIPFGKEGKDRSVYVAVLEEPGIWHTKSVVKEDADKTIELDWKPPFPAHWRVDWRTEEGLTDTWEMLVQKPDGTFARLDWFGQPDKEGTPDWQRPDGTRWTTVLGGFKVPCWIDKDGRGVLRPLKRGAPFKGPAIIYPVDRVQETPLDRLALVDIMRRTLGQGPCEYILDVEGQKKVARGAATCATRGKLDGLYSRKEQKAKRAEVEKALDDVLAFVRLVRDRIEGYVLFGRLMLAYLDEQKKAHPETEGFLAKMETLTRRIDSAYERRKVGIRSQEDATKLVVEFRVTLVDYEGDDALARCKKITGGLVGVGGSQDELVGECRVVVKLLRQQAGLAMATDPKVAPVAREIRRRTQQMLRGPAAYEAPRH